LGVVPCKTPSKIQGRERSGKGDPNESCWCKNVKKSRKMAFEKNGDWGRGGGEEHKANCEGVKENPQRREPDCYNLLKTPPQKGVKNSPNNEQSWKKRLNDPNPVCTYYGSNGNGGRKKENHAPGRVGG